MHLFDLEEVHDFENVAHRRFTDLCDISRLLDRLFNTDEIALVLVLTQHGRLQLLHLGFQLLLTLHEGVV